MNAMALYCAGQAKALPAALGLANQTVSPDEAGSLELDESGQIRKHHNRAPLAFSFQFHDFHFEAEVELAKNSRVRLTAPLGKLPFTAEAPSVRRHLREIIQATQYHGGGRFFLSPEQDITFKAEAEPPAPFTPVSVMATVVSLLLKSQPLLDPIRDMMGGLRRKPA